MNPIVYLPAAVLILAVITSPARFSLISALLVSACLAIRELWGHYHRE